MQLKGFAVVEVEMIGNAECRGGLVIINEATQFDGHGLESSRRQPAPSPGNPLLATTPFLKTMCTVTFSLKEAKEER